MNIRKKMAKGAFWSFIEKGMQQISSFIVFAIIARMIGPEEYGLVALCWIFVALASCICNGLVDAIISMKIRDDKQLSTLFWSVITCGIIISLFTFISAESFSKIMGNEKLIPLIKYFSILPFLLSLISVPNALITATMDFRVFAIRTFFSTIISAIVGITLAIKGYGAYALLTQHITLYIVMNIVIWPSCKWYPKWLFQLIGMKEAILLGMARIGSSLMTFAEKEFPRVLLGVYLGPTAVGLYAFSMRIRYVPEEALIYPILNVIYPAFSEIRDDIEQKKKILNETMFMLGSLLLPVAFGAAVTSSIFVPLIFGEGWKEAVPLLEILFFTSPFICLGFILRDIARAHKITMGYFRLQMILVFLGSCFLVFLARYGLLAFTAGTALLFVIYFAAYTTYVSKKTDLNLLNSYKQLTSPLIAALSMSYVVHLIPNYFKDALSQPILLVICIFSGALIYTLLFYVLEFKRIGILINYIKRNKAAD